MVETLVEGFRDILLSRHTPPETASMPKGCLHEKISKSQPEVQVFMSAHYSHTCAFKSCRNGDTKEGASMALKDPDP